MDDSHRNPKCMTVTNGPGTYETRLSIRDHCILSDEMPKYGGNDAAPDPHDYIVGGAVACAAISLRMYADKKGWDIGNVNIDAAYENDGDRKVIRKVLSFSGNVSDEQKKVLLRVAHCSTEKMIEEGRMSFESALAE